jgi:cytochrome c oxidase assembly protein subunit 15
MFLFPISQWVGGIFYEHTHRLLASCLGFLTIILCVWLLVKEERPWLRKLGVVALIGVILQGVLGGLRVTLYKAELGIFHATIAQLFFVLICSITLFTSRFWGKVTTDVERFEIKDTTVRWKVLTACVIILAQLILGASMRHQHAGLAVPDFPLAYGKVWPATDDVSLERYNHQRTDVPEFNSITAGQIQLHMAHRLGAVLVLCSVILASISILRSGPRLLRPVIWGWLGLLAVQATLGAWTVLSNKAADIATLHVVVGALSLVVGSMLAIISARLTHRLAVLPADAAMQDPRGSWAVATK